MEDRRSKPFRTAALAVAAGASLLAASAQAARSAHPPAADALHAWWEEPAKDGFSVLAVGPEDAHPGVVVRFSKPLADPQSASQRLILTRDGKAVGGEWKPGANPEVLVHEELPPGRYLLRIDQTLASADGQTLGNTVWGPVFVVPQES